MLTFIALTLVERALGASVFSPSRLLVGPVGLLTVAKGGFRGAFDPAYHGAIPWWLLCAMWAAVLSWLLPLASRAGIRQAGRERGFGALRRRL